MPTCFVIMPYGGDDPEKRRHFDGVYTAVIRPAVESLGFDCKRSDLAGAPGNITADIIQDLATADIVVADLTTGNANVFFELGISHVLRRSGTVHLIDDKEDISFDVRPYRAVRYSSTDFARIPEVAAEIARHITARQAQPDRSDNPVHDTLQGLPANYFTVTDAALRQEIEDLRSSNERLLQTNSDLERRLGDLDPTNQTQTPGINVDKIFDEADSIMASRGPHALLRLHRAIEEGGPPLFLASLREILQSEYLEENDFDEIAILCGKFGLPDHQRAVLEVAAQRYPGDRYQLSLARAYLESPSKSIQERGRIILERLLGIESDKDGLTMTRVPLIDSPRTALASLFNHFIGTNQWNQMLTLVDSALKLMPPDILLLRSKALALSHLRRFDDAESTFKEAIALNPRDDTVHAYYGSFLFDRERFKEGYEEEERAIQLDPKDPTRWINLAISILNHGYVRNPSTKEISKVKEADENVFAIPLIRKAMEVAEGSTEAIQHAVGILVRAGAVAEAAVLDETGMFSTEYDDAIVQGILSTTGD